MERDDFERRQLAHDIAGLLNRLTAMGSTPHSPDFIFRIIDARSREVLDSGQVDGVIARAVCSDLAAMADELTLQADLAAAAGELAGLADEPGREPKELPELSVEEAVQVLYNALANLGPDTDRAAMATLRLPDGRYVGDVWLSKADVQALTVQAGTVADHRTCFEQTTPTTRVPSEQQITALADEVAQFLENGGTV